MRESAEATVLEPGVMGVTRSGVRLQPDARRVIIRPFMSGLQLPAAGQARARRVIDHVLRLTEDEVANLLAATRARFADRHRDLDDALLRHYLAAAAAIPDAAQPSRERRLLIGAYFSHEYAIEAAALTNPSMVLAPDQSGLAPGQQRFIVSLRAVGEGHLSSIEFRSGVLHADGRIALDTPSRYVTPGTRVDPPVGGTSDYALGFEAGQDISERVIFPSGPAECRGMEDARFVRFRHDDGTVRYYATYTGFDGVHGTPRLIETSDFVSFDVCALEGEGARDKGMALFPRMVGGRYTALSRQDGESNWLLSSDDIRTWRDPVCIQQPDSCWELIQLGNCGSPLETEAGWLVITHGVGPMRCYALGAILLDLDDPRHVIGHLDGPLLAPAEDERDGYVPNVVYSCGSLLHGSDVVIPYGYSDRGCGIATIPLADILGRLRAS